MKWFKRALTPTLIIAASLLMWIEESLWRGLKRLTHWIALLPLMRRVEMAILQLPAQAVIVVFLFPMIALFPLKLIAVYLLLGGHFVAAASLVLFAKLLGTAIAARLYVVCQPKLMTIGWFRLVHDGLIRLRDRLYAAVRLMPIYQAAREMLLVIRQRSRDLLQRLRGPRGISFRWQAIRRLLRRRFPAAVNSTNAQGDRSTKFHSEANRSATARVDSR